FRARPENIVGLKYAGIDLVTLGNNHIIDYGEEGMLQTMELLDTLRIRHSGAGINEYFALQPTFWTEKGVRIAFLGQCNRTGRLWNYQPFLDAGYNKCGFGNFITQNIESSINNVRDVADIVILQGHSGTEYQTEPPDKFLGEPPPVEANEIGPDDPDFRFNIEPSAGDRALRRQVIDFGADIMINHHPHVLQGFESYNGKLIAHSLGNFVFELYYPETMPTIVLTLEITKNGIMGYTFTPAWIDDYIPKPAIGQFGREIMDRMAEYSRKMGAIVATDPEISRARIYLSRDDADSTQTDHEATVPFVDLGGYRITPPIEVSSDGNLSEIINAVGSGLTSYEVCWGSEILWHGNFEDEGATFWDDNTSDEWLDASEAHSGQRSLALRRHDYDSAPVGTDLEKNLPCYPEHRHTCAGYLKAENAKDAIIMNRFYSSRTSTTPIISTDIGDRFSGSQDWTFRWQDLETPENAIYFDIRCENDAPSSGTGMAWFDDLKLIQWEPWFTGQTPVSVPSPNNHRFIQIRTTDTAVAEATINYKTTSYNPNPADAPDPMVRISEASWIRNFPNPARGNTTIELRLPQATGPLVVDLAIFYIQGRRVANLFKGRVTGGTPYTYQWDGSDDRGRGLASGVYFSRAVVNGDARSQKILILR
ncbi:MAG: CapA family protein, partial [Candidatus Eisenbacteria bacterium]|nr:CapA family protein [Candidatus Eisenbacteria bacterium]